MPRPDDAVWWQVAAGFTAGFLAMAMLAGQAFAWIQRRRCDLVGAA